MNDWIRGIKKGLPIAIGYLSVSYQIDIKTETLFDSDSSVLKKDGKKLASELGDIFFKLLSNEDIKEKIDYLEIVGHTDFAGSTNHGRELSTELTISF